MTTPTESDVESGSTLVAQDGGFCAACGAKLATGARFCHRCGQPVGDAVPPRRYSAAGVAISSEPMNMAAVLPWGIAAIALFVIVGVFAFKDNGPQASDAAATPIGIAPQDASSAGAPPLASAPEGSAGPAPSIANLSPSERAKRLYTRLMRYADAGNADSISFFAPMALASHGLLETPTADERFHFGRVAEVTGHADVAAAQADTILQQQRTSLLGLVLASRAARMTGNEAAAKGFDQRLLKALDAELARKSPDDDEHRAEIDRAVADARKGK